MGYLKIPNLYKSQEVLLFKEVFCMEKIHGSSSHIGWDGNNIKLYAGGEKHERFVEIFDQDFLIEKFKEEFGVISCTIFGEVYGGKCQGMSDTYGKELKFVVFDVKVEDVWLNVPKAENVTQRFGLEFVHYVKTTTNLEDLDREKNRDSVQAIRNGMGKNHPSEGIVIRPLEEFTMNNGQRVIAKHKKDEFRETRRARKVVQKKDWVILKKAEEVAQEWVTSMRLQHVVDKISCDIAVENIGKIIPAMIEDIRVESVEEVVWNRSCEKSIGKATALLVKNILRKKLK